MQFNQELIFLAAEKTALAQAEGNFARKVAVLFLAEPNSAANREFIAKVLSAANLNLQQDTLFAELPAHEPVSIAPDLKERKPGHVLVFGISPAQLGLSIQISLYHPTAFYGATWLFADSLSTLEPDKNRKSQLWNGIKTMFL
ncbi:MAG TPA: hypothetical protein DCF33_05015 [Saprospirales bacterium]|nr:hypothetical protein [Saprospirales bacterium]